VGLISCPDLVPDLDGLLDAILEGFDVLLARARERPDDGAVDLTGNGSDPLPRPKKPRGREKSRKGTT